MTRYVHTLLFTCPECAAPVAISDVRDEKNTEGVDAKTYRVLCDHCSKSHDLLGVLAKAHWVNEWSAARGTAAGD